MAAPRAQAGQSSRGRTGIRRAGSPSRRQSRSCWFALGLIAIVATAAAAKLSGVPAAGPDASPGLALTIRVYNYARVSTGKLRRAQSEASRIIGAAGVETVWLDCTAPRLGSPLARGSRQQECRGEMAGATVILRVLSRSDYNSAALHQEVFGYADGSALTSVIYDSVAALADADGDTKEAPVILGDAMAHEIGHLLLGSGAHSSIGIMRGRWDRVQLQRALMGRLLFTPDQSMRIRAAMEARVKPQSASQASLTPR